MISKRILLFGASLLVSLTVSTSAHSPPENAMVYFVDIKDGDVVTNPFKVTFGITGFGITPAGTSGRERHTGGHHHLLIDVDQLPDLDDVIPDDEQHIHFDQGETEVTLKLPFGKHTLQLLLGDEQHEPQDPPLYSEKITIRVK